MVSSLCWQQNQQAVFLIIGIASVCLILLTSKFGHQFILFSSLLFVVLGKAAPLQIYLLGLGISIPLSFGHSLRIIRGHIKHSICFLRDSQERFLQSQKSFKQYRTHLKEHLRCNSSGLRWIFKEMYPWHQILALHPVLPVLLFLNGFGNTPQNPLAQNVLLWVFVSFMLFILIRVFFKTLFLIGEAERYPEQVTFFIYLSFFLLLPMPMHIPASVLILIYQIAAYRSFYEQYQKSHTIIAKTQKHLVPLIQKYNEAHKTAFPIGHHFGALFFAGPLLQVPHYCINKDPKLISKEDNALILEHYPYPSKNLATLIQKYKVDYIFTSTQDLLAYKEQTQSTFFDDLKPLEQNGDFLVFAIESSRKEMS